MSMVFRSYGRSCHLRVDSADELANVLKLNEAHWVATGAPIDTLHCDRTFLDLVDLDHDGRILCYEVRQAVSWLLDVLSDTNGVNEKREEVSIEALNTQHADGANIAGSLRKMLAQLGREQTSPITLAEVRRFKRKVEDAPVSEAGVVLPEAAEEADLAGFITDVIAVTGGSPHPGGERGLTRAQLGSFLRDARAYLDWLARARLSSPEETTDIMPLGERTDVAWRSFAALTDKVDQYFAQCRAMALDERLIQRFSPRADEISELELTDPARIDEVLREAPLAKPTSERTLDLAAGVNPFYVEALAALKRDALEPILRQKLAALTETDWNKVKSVLAEHRRWLRARPNEAIESIGTDKLNTYLDERFRSGTEELINDSSQTAFVLDNIRLTEKLLLYQSRMLEFANNFVSFPDLYDRKRRAMFEMGTFICDGRRFNMAVRAGDRAAHAKVAKTSEMFVLYVQTTSRADGSKQELAIPVTSGGKGNLCIGKRGIFQDVAGEEHDAVVLDMIENPISLREALVSPFQRVGRALTGKIEALTTQAEKNLDTPILAATQRQTQPQPAAARPAGGLAAGGLLMGGGVALAALGSAVAYITKTLHNLESWTPIIYGIGVLILIVMIPVSVVALMKLRRRDLSAILEGSGWAINARMRLTRSQSHFFTQSPKYPADARGTPRQRWWLAVIVIAVVIGAILAMRAYWPKADTKPEQTAPTPETKSNAQ